MKNYFVLFFLLCATVINAQVLAFEVVQELEKKQDLPSDIDSLVTMRYYTYGLDDARPDTVLMINDQEYELYLQGGLKTDYSVENEATEIYTDDRGLMVRKQRKVFSEEGQQLIQDRYVRAYGGVLNGNRLVSSFDDKGRIIAFKELNLPDEKEGGMKATVAYNENNQIQEIKLITPVSTVTTTLEMVGDTTRYWTTIGGTIAALGIANQEYIDMVYDESCECKREIYKQKDLETGDVEIKRILSKNAKGQLIEIEERMGGELTQHEKYEYTPSGELLSTTYVLDDEVMTNEFREDGKMTIKNDVWEKIVYEYDEKGHVVKEIKWSISGGEHSVDKVTLTKVYYR